LHNKQLAHDMSKQICVTGLTLSFEKKVHRKSYYASLLTHV